MKAHNRFKRVETRIKRETRNEKEKKRFSKEILVDIQKKQVPNFIPTECCCCCCCSGRILLIRVARAPFFKGTKLVILNEADLSSAQLN